MGEGWKDGGREDGRDLTEGGREEGKDGGVGVVQG